MKIFPFVAAIALAGMQAVAAEPACGVHGTKDTMLVSTAWLADHLKSPEVVVLAVGPQKDYDEDHVPGAVYLNMETIATKNGEQALNYQVRTMDELSKAFANMGVSNTSHVVIYAMGNAWAAAARAYVTLDAMGLGAKASMLDGGFATWQEEKRAVNKDAVTAKAGKIQVCPQADVIADLNLVKDSVKKPGTTIVDSRLPVFYSGEQSSMKHAGRIPGAVNVPFSSLVDAQGKLKPNVAQMFADAGVKKGEKVITYCHIGQQASLVYFVARYLGFDARMYDGSWDEWSSHPELPYEPEKK
jgi:thiosulfate/3-mercaptopyruvate sulfurtransferase